MKLKFLILDYFVINFSELFETKLNFDYNVRKFSLNLVFEWNSSETGIKKIANKQEMINEGSFP